MFLKSGMCSFERIRLHFKAIFRRLTGCKSRKSNTEMQPYDTTKDISVAKDAAGHTTSAMTLKHYVKGRPQKLNAAKTVSMLYGLPGGAAM